MFIERARTAWRPVGSRDRTGPWPPAQSIDVRLLGQASDDRSAVRAQAESQAMHACKWWDKSTISYRDMPCFARRRFNGLAMEPFGWWHNLCRVMDSMCLTGGGCGEQNETNSKREREKKGKQYIGEKKGKVEAEGDDMGNIFG